MCEASIIADDWVTKGCHIDVNGIELMVYDDHKGQVCFRPVFSSTSNDEWKEAVKLAYDLCLPDPLVRKRWIAKLNSATVHMLGYRGELISLARGRMAEFKFLRLAIE